MSGTNVYFKGKWKSQTFTSSGTFNVPDRVDTVFVEMYGGGGGGGANPVVPTSGVAIFGGEGAKPVTTFVSVTPGGSVPVTIGSGGAGASAPSFQGAKGGDTSFGGLVARGAVGGTGQQTGGVGRSGERGNGGSNSVGESWGGDGAYGNGGNGEAGVNPATNGGTAAGGGGGPGGGGDGGDGICIVWYKED